MDPFLLYPSILLLLSHAHLHVRHISVTVGCVKVHFLCPKAVEPIGEKPGGVGVLFPFLSDFCEPGFGVNVTGAPAAQAKEGVIKNLKQTVRKNVSNKHYTRCNRVRGHTLKCIGKNCTYACCTESCRLAVNRERKR